MKIGFGTPPRGVRIGTPSTATVMIEEPGMPDVIMSVSPGSVSENGGVSTVTAWLGYSTEYEVTVTVRVEAGNGASSDDFTLSENRTLTIPANSRWSTGTVTVTAVDDAEFNPTKALWVRGSVTGLPGTTEASARSLYIEDDDPLGVTLTLTPNSISENGGVSTVTATLNGTASDDVTVTVAAAPVAPAVANDFALTGTTLTISAGQTSSTGTVTITANDNDLHGAAKSVTVTGTVTGSMDVAAPAAQTLTITDDETAPTLTLELDPTSISENGGESTVTATLSGPSSEDVTLTVSATPVSPAVADDFELSGNTELTITAGRTESTGTVTITANDNGVDASAKNLTVAASVTAGPTGLTAPASKTLTITDDEDAPTVTLVLTPDEISEDNGVSTVTAQLSHATSEEIRVTVSAAAVSPAAARDFELSAARVLTIAGGATESTGTVTVTGKDDGVDGPNKEVTVSAIVSGLTGLAAPASETLTITDDEGAPTVTLVLTPDEISEDGGVSTVTARLSHATNADIEVTVSASAVSPAVAGDFDLSTVRVLTITAGQMSSTGTVTVTANGNTVDAPNKEVTISATVSGLTDLAVPAPETLTITDDDTVPTVTLHLSPDAISEEGGVSTVTARLSHATTEEVRVTVSAAAVSPATASDFELSASPVLTIAAGQTGSAGTVTVTAKGNSADAPDKELTVSGAVTGPTGMSDPATQTLTIRDDDATPTVILVLSPTSVAESGGVSTVTARLSHATSEEVRVTVSAAAVAPAVARDFELSAGPVLTIAVGQTLSSGTVTVTATTNSVDAPDKRVTVSGTAAGPTGMADPASKTLTITDDDATPTVTLVLTPPSITENEGVSTVTARLNGATSQRVTVTVMVPPAAGDYALSANAVLTIAQGQTVSTGTVTITAVDDTVDGPDVDVPVTGAVSGPVGMTAPAPATLTIMDDEATPTVALMLSPASMSENGGVSRVTARLSHATSEEVRVTVSASADAPAVARDFELSLNPVLTIARGATESTGTVSVSAADNAVDAPDKEVTIAGAVAGPTGMADPASKTLTIRDDEATPTVTLALSPVSISENGGVSTVTAHLSGTTSEEVRVTVSASAVPPAVAGDFNLSPSRVLTIAKGAKESTGAVTITASDNPIDAPDKEATVSGTVAGPAGMVNPASQTLAIRDDEVTPTVTLVLSPASISEEGGVSTVTATLNHGTSEEVRIAVSADAVSPAAAGDFALSSNRVLTIAKGAKASTGTVTVTARGNTMDTPNKEVTVSGTVTAPAGVANPVSQTLAITDDEGTPTVTLVLTPASISENTGRSTVTARLSGTTSADVRVTVSAAAVPPAAPGDFTLSSDPVLTIAVGATASTGTVTVTAENNAIDAPNKEVTIAGTIAGSTGLANPAPQALTITDDEGTPTVTLVLTPASIAENAGVSTVTARLSGATSEEVRVTVAAEAVSPAVAGDFELSSSPVLTIAVGATASTGTVTVTAENNVIDAPDKEVTVSGAVTGPEGMAPPADLTLTIRDDEAAPTVTLVLTPDEIAENGGVSEVTARLSGASSATVTVTVMVAADPNEYSLSSNAVLTFASGDLESSGLVTVTAKDDTVDAPDQQVAVTGEVSAPLGLTAPEPVTLTITDDDEVPSVTLVVTPASISENGGVSRVTARLSHATSEEVEVRVAAEAVSPDAETYFELSPERLLSIAAGGIESTGTVTVTSVDDAIDAPPKEVTVSGTVTGPAGMADPASQTLTITDDEGTPTVMLAVAPDEVSEGDAATDVTVTASLVGALRSTDTEVAVSVGSGTATSGTDFQAVQSFALTILENEGHATHIFVLTPEEDNTVEGAETVLVSGTNADLTVDPATVTIRDNDAPSTMVKLSALKSQVPENGGPTDVMVKAELNGAPRSEETKVMVSVDPGTATPEEDYEEVPDFEMTIPPNQMSTTRSFMLKPKDDTEVEDDETLILHGETSDLDVEPAVVIIKDNDGNALTGGDDDEEEDDDEATSGSPVFRRARYTFELHEHRDGRTEPVALGTVRATDPDGEAITYTLSVGDATRFAVNASTGVFTYIGPGNVLANDSDPDGDTLRVAAVTSPENGTVRTEAGGVRYTPSPGYVGLDRFRYTVADPGGLSATAAVRVTVLPVNHPPEAVDDEAETLEDLPALVDVLVNDSDPDGDRLRVVSATAPAHGTVTVRSRRVRYAPAPNYHGPDRFRYTISDPGGLTATAMVTLMVLPVNDAPEAVGVVPVQALEEGGEPVTLEVAPFFTDVDGDALTYSAESSNPAAAVVAVNGSTLTLAAVVTGTATVTVTASDPEGLTATQVFGVAVGDRLVREVLTDTLAALGRGHLASVRQTVGRRLETGGADTPRMMVGGQMLGPGLWGGRAAGGLAQAHDWLFWSATLQQPGAARELLGTSADPRLRRTGMFNGFSDFGNLDQGWDQALSGTDVLMTFGGDEDDAGARGRGRRWTIWGQGDLQTFRGSPSDVRGYEGDLRTGYIGFDTQVGSNWLLGVAAARSGGQGAWQAGTAGGRLETTLTRAHPYVRWASGDTAVWGVAGLGRGTATLVRTVNGQRDSSPLRLALGLVEGRRRVATVGPDLEVAVRGEASWAQLATGGAGDTTVDALEAGVRRTRGGVEVTRALSGPGGSTWTPFGAVSTRHDGGSRPDRRRPGGGGRRCGFAAAECSSRRRGASWCSTPRPSLRGAGSGGGRELRVEPLRARPDAVAAADMGCRGHGGREPVAGRDPTLPAGRRP